MLVFLWEKMEENIWDLWIDIGGEG